MDSNGVEDGLVPFEVKVIVKDDSVVVDMSEARLSKMVQLIVHFHLQSQQHE